jgi:hypothetical protein
MQYVPSKNISRKGVSIQVRMAIHIWFPEALSYSVLRSRSRSRKELHLLVGAGSGAVTRCGSGSGSDGSGSDNGIKHG